MAEAPIVFIHYGRARFLTRVLAAARRSNPGKAVYLLGDETNQDLVPSGVGFQRLSNCRRGELLAAFRRAFVPIAGRTHHFNKAGGMETWLRFVFERWFVVLEFLRSRNIGAFWIFDSDTLISGDLALREARFAGLDATEQCGGCCLNGYVSSSEVVQGYCEKMVELFQRQDYLSAQRQRLEIHTGLAFNEMDAWQTHREEAGLKTVALGLPHDGEAYDDALGITGGWQTARQKVRGRIPVKRLLGDSRGGYFGFSNQESEPVRLVTLNLSWLPDYVYKMLAPGCKPVGRIPFDERFCSEMDFSEPLGERVLRGAKEAIWKIRNPPRKGAHY